MSRCCKCLWYLLSFKASEPSVDVSHEVEAKAGMSLENSAIDQEIISDVQHIQKNRGSPTNEEAALISQALENMIVLRNLSHAKKATLPAHMVRVVVAPNQVIAHPNQQPPFFYVLTAGVVKAKTDGQAPFELTSGMTIGGPACANSALIVAETPCVLWRAELTVLRDALSSSELPTAESIKNFVRSMPLFSNLRQDQIESLAERMKLEHWFQGEEIVDSRDPARRCWFVRKGRIQCSATGKTLTESEFFSRFPDPTEPFTTVLALEDTTLGSLSVRVLHEIIGDDLSHLLARHTQVEALARSKVFSSLTDSQVNSALELMTIHHYTPGDTIMSVGDMNRLVIILKGTVLHDSKKFWRSQCLGESWFSNAKGRPHMPFVAITPVETAECSQKDIKAILQPWSNQLRRIQTITNSLRRVQLFQTLPKTQLQRLAETARIEEYSDSQTILKEGTLPTALYVIKKGSVHITCAGKRLRTLKKFSYFGERLLMTDGYTTTSAVASGRVQCWVLNECELSAVVDSSTKHQLTKRIQLQDGSVEFDSLISVKKIGEGLWSAVHLCAVRNTQLYFTVKVIKLAAIIRFQLFDRVSMERKVLMQIDHPFFPKLVKIVKNSYRLFVIMEHVPGIKLEEALSSMGVIDEAQLRFYAACLVLALQYLHKKNIVHRNLKPANIIIDQEGYLKVIDFSTAKVLKGRTSTSIGTPHYMAPEVIQGTSYGLNADLWSLGVLLYELANGTVPFGEGETSVLMVYKFISAAKVPPPFKVDGYSQEFQGFVKQLLSTNPESRCDKKTSSLKKHPWLQGIDWVRLTQNQLLLRSYQPLCKVFAQHFQTHETPRKRLQPQVSLDHVAGEHSLICVPPQAKDWYDNF